jgi:hypothetical protein
MTVALHIGSLTADVTVLDGELPLGERQLHLLADAVLRVLAARERDAARQRDATCITGSAQPPPAVGR